MRKLIRATGILVAGLWAASVQAAQWMDPIHKEGMTVQGMFIQAVVMKDDSQSMADHSAHGHDHHNMGGDADIHLEMRLTADENNPYGFIKGSWIPYVKVGYNIRKKGDRQWSASGSLAPMMANDGPHYGGNVKLNGIGKYEVTFHISQPQIMYHADKETGISGWWKPFTVKWNIVYTGVGKKGGY